MPLSALNHWSADREKNAETPGGVGGTRQNKNSTHLLGSSFKLLGKRMIYIHDFFAKVE